MNGPRGSLLDSAHGLVRAGNACDNKTYHVYHCQRKNYQGLAPTVYCALLFILNPVVGRGEVYCAIHLVAPSRGR
jgi:hypothetical protein